MFSKKFAAAVVVVTVVTEVPVKAVALLMLTIVGVDAVFAVDESAIPLVWLGSVPDVPAVTVGPEVVLEETTVAETVDPLIVEDKETPDEPIDGWVKVLLWTVPAKQKNQWW